MGGVATPATIGPASRWHLLRRGRVRVIQTARGSGVLVDLFRQVACHLRLGGVAVLQVITIAEEYFESYRRRPDFFQKDIFPGEILPTRGIIEREVAPAGLCLSSCEFFGMSYARTLSEWLRRFEKALPAIHAQGFDTRFNRTWGLIAVPDLRQVFWTSGSIRSSGPEVVGDWSTDTVAPARCCLTLHPAAR
jgi:Mycolic acid cyclopropane synthetase